MVILMKTTRKGADDGVTVRTYDEGGKYELPDTARGRDLGELFVREGWAQELKEGAVDDAPPAPTKTESPPSSPAPVVAAAPTEPPPPPPAPPAPAAKGKQRR